MITRTVSRLGFHGTGVWGPPRLSRAVIPNSRLRLACTTRSPGPWGLGEGWYRSVIAYGGFRMRSYGGWYQPAFTEPDAGYRAWAYGGPGWPGQSGVTPGDVSTVDRDSHSRNSSPQTVGKAGRRCQSVPCSALSGSVLYHAGRYNGACAVNGAHLVTPPSILGVPRDAGQDGGTWGAGNPGTVNQPDRHGNSVCRTVFLKGKMAE